MGSLIPALNNSKLVPDDVKKKLEAKLKKGTIGPLSPERESGPFMLFACGDNIDTIALKTNFPKEMLYLTALHYEWELKVKLLHGESGEFNAERVKKDLANTLLVATYISAKEQLQAVLSGRKKAEDCPLIPSNTAQLDKLMNMLQTLENPPNQAGSGGTVVNAQNVQINNSSPEKEIASDDKDYKEERKKKYKALKGDE